ncbi:MAG: hypothetical protein ACKVT0_20715 [Planctomycetaceae bacterium]
MKNIGSKLKSMNYKQAAIDHLEKMVFGLFAFITLLSLVTARWKGFDKAPEELQFKTDEAKTKILASTWPEEKKKEFLVDSDVRERVKTLVSPVEPARWDYGNEGLSWPLQKKKVLVKEPEWLAVEELEATPGRFILSERLPEEDLYEGDPGYDEMEVPEEEIDEFTPRTDVGAVDGAARGLGPEELGAGKAGALAGRPGMRAGGKARPGAGAIVDAGRAGGGPAAGRGRLGAGAMAGRPGMAGKAGLGAGKAGKAGEMMPMMGAMAGEGTTGSGKGRGVRFIAVRGVFNIWKQLDKVLRASGQTLSAMNSGELLEFLDFTLERQTAVAGDDQWSGPWEKVNIQVAKDLLSEAAEFDPDVVDSGITDNVFTMPLPARGLGYWTEDIASHPLVRNYQLSPEEMERELKINEKLIEQYQKMEEQSGKRFTAKPGGFADQTLDIRGIRQDVFQYGQGNEFLTDLGKDMDPENREKTLMNNIKERVSAQGRVLLFRYFDFDIVPENAYRYRVRLTVRNPNYDRSLAEVIEPSVIEGETRDTNWSEPSNPAYVARDVRYFMDKVQLYRTKSVSGALFDVYQWYPASGTTVNKVLPVALGQPIGGEFAAHVLRPLEQSFEEEKKVQFDTGDLLVDARDATKLNIAEHPDLQLQAKDSGRTGSVVQALVMNRSGDLVAIDPVSSAKARESAKKQLEREQSPFEPLKDAVKNAEEEASSLDDLLAPADAAASPEDRMGIRGRGKNPLRRAGGGREAMMRGAMPGAMPAGGAGPRGGRAR